MTSDMLIPYLFVMFVIIVGSIMYTNRPARKIDAPDDGKQSASAADRASP